MEGGQLDAAPIWSDLKSFPWAKFRGLVDIISGGYPCQPFSAVGRRAGSTDERHLWPYIADGIASIKPRLCFFENVEGHISLGLSTVISDLEGLGYRVSWGIFSASEVGAPHQRKRVFILAHRIGTGLEGLLPDIGTQGREVAWGSSAGCSQDSREWRKVSFAGDCDEYGNCSICGFEYSDCGCPGPTQDGFEYREHGGELLAREASVWPARPNQEQHQWEPPRVLGKRKSTQPPLGGNPDGSASGMDYAKLCESCDNRTDELRLLGNGVVPATAEKAFRVLLEKLQHNTQ
jgi:DNA (cytosine-5)-methyltransferase 1